MKYIKAEKPPSEEDIFNMSLIIIVGECGKGKSSLAMVFAEDYINKRGAERWEFTEKIIREENAKRATPLEFPSTLPVYSNIDFTIKNVNGNDVKPIPIKGNQIGVNNHADKKLKYVYLYPASLIILDEMQTEFPSKEIPLPKGQQKFFTTHRHDDLEMIMLAPRGVFIHKDIRCSGATIIEVIGKTHVKNIFGTTCQTIWLCRKFLNYKDFEEYQSTDGKSGNFKEVLYSHDGNVYDFYDDHEHRQDYIPPEGAAFYAGIRT